jgi:type II secretory pathway component PulL
MKASMDMHQKKMEVTIHSIQSKLEETIRHQVENILLCIKKKDVELLKGTHEED